MIQLILNPYILKLLTGCMPYKHHVQKWKVRKDIELAILPVLPDDMIIHGSPDLFALLKKCWVLHLLSCPNMDEVEKELDIISLGLYAKLVGLV